MTQKRFLDHFGLIRLEKAKMGSQAEMQRMERGPTSHTKATFSGMTAFIGVLSLLITIISVATPHWGSYSPIGQSYYSAGKVFSLFVYFWVSLGSILRVIDLSGQRQNKAVCIKVTDVTVVGTFVYTMIYIL